MTVTDTMLDEMRQWYRNHWTTSSPAANGHYLYFARFKSREHIIYGMDDPQKRYLLLLQACAAFKPKPAARDVSQSFRNFLKSRLTADLKGKAWDDHVSNYVLDVESSDVAWDAQGKSRLERTPRPVSAGNPDATTREASRKSFTQKYETSHFGLQKAPSVLSGIQKNQPEVDDIWQLTGHEYALDLKSYVVRRACKYLLYDSNAAGKTVVYALDDLNLQAVADRLWLVDANDGSAIQFKTRVDAASSAGFRKVPVCTTELRELFRSWDHFGGRLTSTEKRVEFMRGFVPAPPPWETSDQAVWAAYAERLTDKWFSKLPPLVQTTKKALADNVKSRRRGSDFKGAIDAYHALGIGEFKSNSRALPVSA